MKDDSSARINERLSVLTALPTLKNGSIGEALKKRISRARFYEVGTCDDGVYGVACINGADGGLEPPS